MSGDVKLYDFVFRGLLTEEALDRAGRNQGGSLAGISTEIAAALNLAQMDPEVLEAAMKMGTVYTAIAAFENSSRHFVAKVLVDAHGPNWWHTRVSEKIREKAESRRTDEEQTKWHGRRGDDPINYTEMGQLVDIMQQNWTEFEPHVRRLEWARELFGAVERSRNVIMHSGTLDLADIERLGMNMRDWIRQIGV